MYAWTQEGYKVASVGRPLDGQVEMVQYFDKHGFTGSLGTNVDQEYFADGMTEALITKAADCASESDPTVHRPLPAS